MASTVSPYLATFVHPVYSQRYTIINALTLASAQAMAAAQIAGTLWTVRNVQLFVPPGS